MPEHANNVASLRLGRLELSRLGWALGLSVALHLVVWGGYEGGKKLGIWQKLHVPAWIKAIMQPSAVAKKKESPPDPIEREAPLMFVDVSALQAMTEPPKDAKYYSDKNSQAANQETDKETGVPKVTGQQTQIVKAEDVPRNRFDKLQPSAPAERDQEPVPAKPLISPGDLALAKPELNPRDDKGTAEQSRPRTLKEAKARQTPSRLVGQKMKQEGGVKRRLEFSSLDAKATPFGLYDRAFIEAVQQRWFDLLDSRHYDGARQGRVVLQFHLKYDGTISDMEVVEDNVGIALSILCRSAVTDPAPFEKWPRDMRMLVGEDFRQIRFTFYYN